VLTRDELIAHIMKMKNLDPDYARYALQQYNALLPHFELNAGIREAMKEAA